jgi:hypothetical protein
MTKPERIGVKEASLVLGLPERSVQAMAARGEIPSAAKFGRWTFNENELRAHALRDDAERAAFKAARQAEYEARDPFRGARVYVAQCGNQVKIGTTKNVHGRIESFRRVNPFPIHLLAVINGDRAVEASFHVRFAKYRTRGEWFLLSDEIKQWIKRGCW